MRNIPHILAGSIAALFQRRPKLTRAGLLLAALTGAHAQAQSTHTWNGGIDLNWGNAANWTGGVPDGNDLVNIAGAGGGILSNVYAGFTNQYRLFFNSGAGTYTLNGPSTVTFFDFGGNNPKIENNSANTQTINFGVVMNSGAVGSAEINPTDGNLVFGSTVDLAGITQLRIFGSNNKTVTFNGAVTSTGNGGANQIAINQNSTVVFAGANTYTGDTFINAGKLQFAQGSSSASAFLRLGDTAGAVAAELGMIDADGGTTVASQINVRAGSSGAKTIAATNTSGTNTFSGSVFLDADVAVSTATSGTLAFTGTAFDLKNQTLTAGGTGTTTISGVVQNSTGSGKITKTGAGTLTLSNTNTYTGLTTLSAGILSITNGSALGTTAAGTVQSGASELRLSGGITTLAEALSINGGGISNAGALRNISGNNTYAGTITMLAQSRVNSDSGTLTLSAANSVTASNFTLVVGGAGNVTATGTLTLGTGGVLKDGAGTATLTGVNTYTGATTVSVGVLNIQNASALGTTAAGTSVTSGAALQIQGGITTAAEALTLSGTGIATDGALRNISGANNFAGLLTLGAATRINSDAGTLTISNAGTITGATFGLTVGGAADTVINSIIGTTTGTLTKDGTGALTLTGVNTYTGVTSALGGTLFVGAAAPSAAAGALGNASSAVLLGNTTGAVNASILTTGAFTVARPITLQSGNTGVITLGGNTAAASVFSGAILTGTSGANAAKDLSLVALAGGSADFTGIINENTSNTGVTNITIGDATHSGTVKLSNAANAYSGITTIGNGATLEATTLAAGGSNSSIGNSGTSAAAGSVATDLVINNGTFKYSGAVISTNRLFTIGTGGATIDANGTSNAALTFSGTGSLVASGTGNRTLTLTGASTGANTLTSIIPNPSSGTTALSKTGASLWVLGGANTFTGGTTVSAGTLRGIVAGSFGGNTTATALTLAGGTLELLNDTNTTFTNSGTTVTANSTVSSNRVTSGATTTTHTLGTLSIGAQTLTVTRGAGITGTGVGVVAFGATTMTNNAIFAPAASAQLNLGAVGGAFTLTQNGAGTTVLTAASGYSGGTTISAGILQLNNATAAGTNTTITLANSGSGRLFQAGGVTTAYNLVVGTGQVGAVGQGLLQQTGTGQAIFNGTITLNGLGANGGTFVGGTAAGNELVVGGVINGASNLGMSQRDGRVIYRGGGTVGGTFTITGTALAGATNGIPVLLAPLLGGSGAATLDLNGFDQTLAGVQIGNGGNVGTVALGAKTLTLNGDLTTGGTAAQIVTASAGGTIAFGATNRNINVADVAAADDLTITGATITGTAGVNKIGAGTLVARNVGFSGLLNVNAGTIAPSSALNAGTLTTGSLSFGAGATTIRMKVGTGADLITGGTVTTAGTATFNLTQYGALLAINTSYPLITYTGASPGTGGFALGTLPGHVLGNLEDTGSAIALKVTGNDKVVWDATLDGNWNINTTANWVTQLGGAPTNYLEGDAVVFQDAPTGATAGNVTLASSVNPLQVEFTNTVATPYTIAAATAIGINGNAFLTKTGNGIATLRTANAYIGATTISDGTLELDHDVTGNVVLSGTSGVSIASIAKLLLTRDDGGFTYNRDTTGTGTIEVNAHSVAGGVVAHTVLLTGANTGFTGTLRLLAPLTGTYRLGGGAITPAQLGSGSVEVQSGAQIFTSGALTFANSLTISGTGFSETTSGNIGALRLDSGAIWSGNIVVSGSARIGSHNSTGTISGSISGGNLEFNAANFNNSYTTILTGANTYGTTTIGGQNIQVAGVPSMRVNIGAGGTTGTLGTGNVIIHGDGANGVLGFDRSDGYTLLPGQTITGSNGTGTIVNSIARTFIDFDVLGTGFSDNGNAITLGAATTATGGQIRVGQGRAGAIASFTGALTGGTLRVGSGQGNATMNLNSAAVANFGSAFVGVAGANLTSTLNINGTSTLTANYLTAGEASGVGGIINQAAGTAVSVATHARIGHFGTETSTYNLNGGSFTITAASPATTPSTVGATEQDGGIYLGIDGTGILNHTGGTITTNWIVLDNRTDTLAGTNMPDGIDRYNLSGAGSILNLRSTYGIIQRNASSAVSFGGGTVRVDNGGTGTGTGANITIPLDAIIDTVAASTTNLDTNGAGNGLSLLRDVRGTGTLNLSGGGTITFSTAGFQNIAANIMGTAALVKLGAGATTLAGSGSGFTGNVTVSAGRLNVPNDLGAGAITVADSAILSGEPTAVTTLTLGATTGSTLFFDPNTAGAITTGTLTVNGANTLDFTALPTGLGPYTAINYTALTGAGTFVVAGSGNFRTAPVVNDTGSAITVDITGTKVLTWTGTASNAWNINGAINWVDTLANPEKFYTADTVIFPEGGANPSIALTGVIVPNGITVNSSTTAYTFTSTAGNQISGGTGLTKTNGSTLTLVGPNVYTGQTGVGGGSILFSAVSSLGDGSSTNSVGLSGGGRLDYTGSTAIDFGTARNFIAGTGGGVLSHSGTTAATLTIPGNLSGSGALAFRATGTSGTVSTVTGFTLTGNNLGYTGAISIEATGNILTALNLGTQSAVPTSGSITVNYPSGSITNGNANTLNLAGVNLPAGVTLNLNAFVTGGAISQRTQVTTSGDTIINSPITLAGNANSIIQFVPTTTGGTFTVNGNITELSPGAFGGGGPAVLFFRNNGTSILNGTVNLPTATVSRVDATGSFTINSTGNIWAETDVRSASTLRIGANNAAAIGSFLTVGQTSDASASIFDLNGFSQEFNGIRTLTGNGNSTRGITNSSATPVTLTINSANSYTFGNTGTNQGGNLSGALSIVKNGIGIQTLAGPTNTYTGNVTVNGGTLVAGGGATSTVLGSPTTAGRTITVNSAGTLSFTTNNVFGNGQGNANLPAVVINGGTLTANNYNVLGNLTLNGGLLTQASTATGGYEGYQFLGSVTVGGTAVSTITTTNGKADHLAANTPFIVNDATSSSAIDLLVSAPLRNLSSDFSGTGGLTKSGNGTMALTATNVYTGGTAVTGGLLQIGDGIAASGQLAATTVTVSSGATFAYSRPGAVAQSGALNSATVGAGTFNVGGDATTAVTLNAGGNFSGAINVNNGTLAAGATNPWATDVNAPTFTLAAGTTLTNTTSTHAHVGNITMNNATWTTSNDTGSYDGENYQLNGNVTVTGSAASTITRDGSRTNANSGISLRGTRTFDVANVTGDGAVDLTVSTELENTDAATIIAAGASALTKTGAGTLLITTPASYTGATTVNNGILRISGGNDRLPTGTNLTVNGGPSVAGTFDLNGLNQTVGGLSGASGAVAGVITSASGPATLSLGGSGTFTTATSLADTGGNVLTVTKLGSATQELTGQSSFTGVTTVSGGTLRLNRAAADNTTIPTDGSTATTSDITINGAGALVLAASEQIGDSGSITMSSGSLGFAGSGLIETIDKLTVSGGTFSTGANELNVGGATVTWSGGTNTINSGGLVSDKHWVITGGINTVQSNALLRVQNGGAPNGLIFGGTNGPTITLDSHATDPGEILLKQDVTVDATLTGTAQIVSGGAAALPGSIDMNGGTRTWTINNGSAAVDMLVSASITNGALTKAGAGTLMLAANNTFTGATTIDAGTLDARDAGALGATASILLNNGGTLLLSGSGDRLNNSAAMTLNGGTFNTDGLSETLGTLTLTDDSIIDFGAGASTLTFADSTGLWTTGKTLSIWNWSGTPVAGGGTDQLRFTSNGLDTNQLAQIKFYSGAGTGLITGFFGNDFVGGFGEVVPVPEPSSVATVMGLLGLIGWRERRKARAAQSAGRRTIA